MKSKTWLAWAVLCAGIFAGGKYMQAEEAPPSLPPIPIKEDVPPPPPTSTKPATERPIKNKTTEPILAPGAGPVAVPRAVEGKRAATPIQPPEDNQDDPPVSVGDDPLNKQTEQNITLEWVGPAQIKINQPFVYELVVRNLGSTKVTGVVVRDKFAEGMKVTNVEPKGTPEADGFVWNLGSLEPRQDARIKIEMVATHKGEIVCNASVSATSPASAKFRVSEPQIAIKQSGPDKIMVGDTVTISIAVHNPGDGQADSVVIRSQLSDGLKHEKGSEFSYELGALAAGETRTVQIVCDSLKGGVQKVITRATAEGGLESEAESAIQVTEPKLELAVAGPKLRYLDRQAVYTVQVTNPGDSPANNVKVQAVIPSGFKFVSAAHGGRHDFASRTITWFIGTINPGEKKDVQYTATAVQAGQHKHLASAVGTRGIKSDAEVTTAVEGISALLLEVVDVDDPVEVGADTAYEIRVTNQGSREATNVQVHALVPREMQIRGGQGPTNYRTEGQEIIFAPLPKLAPRADAVYRVFVKGTGVGDIRFRAKLVSDSLSEPVVEEESTKIYED